MRNRSPDASMPPKQQSKGSQASKKTQEKKKEKVIEVRGLERRGARGTYVHTGTAET